MADSTLSSYWTAWNRFKAFHRDHNLPFPSLDLITLSAYISHSHSVSSIRVPTIRAYLCGISFFTKLTTGSPHPFTQHPQITLQLKGLQRSEPSLPPTRLPLTIDILTACIQTIRSGYANQHVSSTLESMFLLAFYGFLRCSEFTTTNSNFNPAIHPCLSDLSIHDENTITFTIKQSKASQFRKIPIYLFRLNSPISPYESLANHILYRQSIHALPSDPLFTNEHGTIATGTWFHHHLRQILTISGFSAENFSGHSFRIGAASTAASRGLQDHTIQLLGRWSSQAYQSYIRTNLPDIRAAHNALA